MCASVCVVVNFCFQQMKYAVQKLLVSGYSAVSGNLNTALNALAASPIIFVFFYKNENK